MSMRPLGDRILVRRSEAEAMTAGGLHLPDVARDEPREGVVLAVGPGRKDERGELVTMSVSVGERVLFGPYSGHEVQVNGEKLLIMAEGDVYGVIEE